jgi:hypothetical protein
MRQENVCEIIHGARISRGAYFRICADLNGFRAKGCRRLAVGQIERLSRRHRGAERGVGTFFSATLRHLREMDCRCIGRWPELFVQISRGLSKVRKTLPPIFAHLEHVQQGIGDLRSGRVRGQETRAQLACVLTSSIRNPKSEFRNRLSGSRRSTLSPRPLCTPVQLRRVNLAD